MINYLSYFVIIDDGRRVSRSIRKRSALDDSGRRRSSKTKKRLQDCEPSISDAMIQSTVNQRSHLIGTDYADGGPSVDDDDTCHDHCAGIQEVDIELGSELSSEEDGQ